MYKLFDKVKIKYNSIVGTIVDISGADNDKKYVVESDTENTLGGYGGRWKLYDCAENEIEKI